MINSSARSWGLSFKFALTITVVVAGVAFTIGAVIVTQDWRRFHGELAEKAQLLTHSLAITAPNSILRNDSWTLYRSLRDMAHRRGGAMRQTEVQTAMVLDPDGRVLAHLQPKHHPLGIVFKPEGEEEQRLFKAALAARGPMVLDRKSVV